MTDISAGSGFRTRRHVGQAVYQHRALSKDGISERLFALAFSGLVYPQIWEDPEIDMEAMQLAKGHRVVTIASGGCNMLAYLTASPARIDVVDLNAAHVALNWRPFTLYFRRPLARVLIGAGALALALSFIPVSGQGSLTPGKVFAALGSARIETLAELTGQSPDAAIAALEQAGVTGALPETTVATLAKGDRARQQAILAALFAANPAGAPMNPAAPPS